MLKSYSLSFRLDSKRNPSTLVANKFNFPLGNQLSRGKFETKCFFRGWKVETLPKLHKQATLSHSQWRTYSSVPEFRKPPLPISSTNDAENRYEVLYSSSRPLGRDRFLYWTRRYFKFPSIIALILGGQLVDYLGMSSLKWVMIFGVFFIPNAKTLLTFVVHDTQQNRLLLYHPTLLSENHDQVGAFVRPEDLHVTKTTMQSLDMVILPTDPAENATNTLGFQVRVLDDDPTKLSQLFEGLEDRGVNISPKAYHAPATPL